MNLTKMMKKIKLIIPMLLLMTIVSSATTLNFTVYQKLIIKVEGACGMCETRIEEAAMNTKGVIEADWNEDSHLLTISYEKDNFDIMKLHKNLASVGHDTEVLRANDEVYEDLPDCCHYRSDDNIHKKQKSNSAKKNKKITGAVFEKDGEKYIPLQGANLLLSKSKKGVVTDFDGNFEIIIEDDNENLIASYIGYKSDTLDLTSLNTNFLEIVLSNSLILKEIEITHEKRSTEISFTESMNIHKIGLKELKKAACCNLSESFETNPSVDVNYTDAVTGSKVIELLGLAGKYVQITRESMPYIRGLASVYGMSFTPGPWIEGIQMIKGTGSVINGFESMTGQINLEFYKPESADPLFVNLYMGENGRYEANVNANLEFNERISTGLLVHGSMKNRETDRNKDGFLDEPTGRQFSIMNRWDTYFENGLESKFGINITRYRNIAGQKGFDPEIKDSGLWGAHIENDRIEAFLKIGKVFENENSIGFQTGTVYHNLNSTFGKRAYQGNQKSFYANLIFQQELSSHKNTLKSGISFQNDRFDENVFTNDFIRNESVPGIFTEYSFIPNEKLTLVTGLRADWNNYYGLFFTPRLNIKYSITDRFVLRGAAGRGQKTANIFAENTGLFASSRIFTIENEDESKPYGLNPEISWNFGVNMLSEFKLGGLNSVFTLDYYYSNFINQIIIDIENPMEVNIYNLDGKSYSHSVQAQMDIALSKDFDFRLAYRFNDVKSEFKKGLLEKPLSSRNRAFINLAFETGKIWKFDLTVNWQGRKRVPKAFVTPFDIRAEHYSPDFITLNMQVTKLWKNVFELYAGAENLLNYMQENPIYGASDPFNFYFDSSLIWGPVMGRNIYIGARYNLKK
jgi:outer membrane receptor for ferrienterochelin and colicin